MKAPRLATWLLRWALAEDRRKDVADDLFEEFTIRTRDTSPRAARRWYRRQVAGFVIRRGVRPPRWWSLTDIRLAVRQARRQPIVTATSVLALAAVIGLSIGAFTFARTFVSPDLNLPGGDRLSQVRMTRPTLGSLEHPYPVEIKTWASRARTIESIGAFQFVSPPVEAGAGDPRPVNAAFITPAAFAKLSPPPLQGRLLTEADASPGSPPVVLISDYFWRNRLASDPDVVGRVIRVSGEPRTVVGVMPPDFGFPIMERLWMPLSLDGLEDRSSANLVVWVTRAQGQRRTAIETELTALAQSVAPEPERTGTALSVLPYVDGFTDGLASPLAATALTLLLVFLIAVSLNVANLTMARCATRASELRVRAALGASRGRIIGQLFVEALLASAVAAGLGIVAIDRLLTWALARAGGSVAFWLNPEIDGWTMVYATGLAVVASTLTGVVPAVRVTRRIGHQSGERVASAALGRFAATVLAVQLTASTALLATAGFLGEGLWVMARATPTTNGDQVLTSMLYQLRPPGDPRLPWGSPELQTLRQGVEAELRSLPGVERAAVSLSVPGSDQNVVVFEAEARPGERIRTQYVLAGPEFIETIGGRVHLGRTITEPDADPDAPGIAVVSTRFATFAFGNPASAVGQRIRPTSGGQTGRWTTVVGVTSDLGLAPGDRVSHGEVFLPMVGTDFMYASVRTANALLPEQALRSAVARVDPRIRVTDVQPLSEVGWEARATLGAGAAVLSLLGGLALLLSLAGIYALAALAVTTRTREIGVRLALGGTGRAILRSVLGRPFTYLLLGAALGTLIALLTSQLLRQLPFAIPVSTGYVVPLTAMVLLTTGVLALLAPARRALRLAPTEALRAD